VSIQRPSGPQTLDVVYRWLRSKTRLPTGYVPVSLRDPSDRARNRVQNAKQLMEKSTNSFMSKENLSLDVVSLDFVVERLPPDPKTLGCLEFVAIGFLQHRDDRLAFDPLQQR
jgi:hypothetical protein